MHPFRHKAVLPILALVVAAFCISGCDDDKRAIEAAKAAGAAEERDRLEEKEEREKLQRKLDRLERRQRREARTMPASSAAASAPGARVGPTDCGGGLTVNASTSCVFATNVRDEYNSAGGGSLSIYAYSPVTNQTYVMRCEGGYPAVCRGGNNAVVYIR